MKTNKLLVLILVLITQSRCTNNNIDTANTTSLLSLNENSKDSFKAVITRFELKHHKASGNTIDEFLIENEFLKTITTDFKKIDWYQAKVMFNEFDTLKQRREMMLMDDNSNFFNAITPNTEYFKNIPRLSAVKIKGETLGFKFSTDKDLEIPFFVIVIDSIKTLKE